MAERIQETRERVIRDDSEPEQVVRRVTTRTTNDDVVTATDTADSTKTAARVVWYVTIAIITLLAMRFGLSLLGANRGNAFADLIYSLSYPFAAPFFGLFGYQVSYGLARFEIETLVAMAVYALLGYGIVRLMTINRRDQTI
jgi:hypothetical protein